MLDDGEGPSMSVGSSSSTETSKTKIQRRTSDLFCSIWSSRAEDFDDSKNDVSFTRLDAKNVSTRKKRRRSEYGLKSHSKISTIETPVNLFDKDDEIEELVKCVKAGKELSPQIRKFYREEKSQQNPKKKRRLSMPVQLLSANNFNPLTLLSEHPEPTEETPKPLRGRRRRSMNISQNRIMNRTKSRLSPHKISPKYRYMNDRRKRRRRVSVKFDTREKSDSSSTSNTSLGALKSESLTGEDVKDVSSFSEETNAATMETERKEGKAEIGSDAEKFQVESGEITSVCISDEMKNDGESNVDQVSFVPEKTFLNKGTEASFKVDESHNDALNFHDTVGDLPTKARLELTKSDHQDLPLQSSKVGETAETNTDPSSSPTSANLNVTSEEINTVVAATNSLNLNNLSDISNAPGATEQKGVNTKFTAKETTHPLKVGGQVSEDPVSFIIEVDSIGESTSSSLSSKDFVDMDFGEFDKQPQTNSSPARDSVSVDSESLNESQEALNGPSLQNGENSMNVHESTDNSVSLLNCSMSPEYESNINKTLEKEENGLVDHFGYELRENIEKEYAKAILNGEQFSDITKNHKNETMDSPPQSLNHDLTNGHSSSNFIFEENEEIPQAEAPEELSCSIKASEEPERPSTLEIGTNNVTKTKSKKDSKKTETKTQTSSRKTRSSTKIRKTLPKLQVRHTPMGLPKPVREKKEQFSIEEIYLNKNFRTPTEKKWETIFEFPKENRDGTVITTEKRKKRRLCDFTTDPSQRKMRWNKNKMKLIKGRRKVSKAAKNIDIDQTLQEKLFSLDNALELAQLSP